jgi:trehalose/maltose hydrolase-like predicted phosphorylase
MEDEPITDPAWAVYDPGYDPLRERGLESRFAIANGFLGVRGLPAIFCDPMWVSWPRTYVAGLFDTPNILPSIPALVPAPDWMGINVLVNGEPLLRDSADAISHRRTLDMRRGTLLTTWRSSKESGGAIEVGSRRLVSMADRRTELQLVRLDIGARAEIALETSCVASDALLDRIRHTGDLRVWRTRQSAIGLAMATWTALELDGRDLAPSVEEEFKLRWVWTSAAGQSVRFQQFVAFARSDNVSEDPGPGAQDTLGKARRLGWREVVRRHEAAWDERWRSSDIEVGGDEAAQQVLRFATYHLNSAANPDDDRVSIGARALTGDDYRGHVFWDTEIFLLPFYTLTWPAAARALLMYRYHSLAGARAKAARMGWRGAFYAWESANTGEETTPDEAIGADGSVVKILSGKQEEHVVADVAYAVWHYWEATGDDGFLLDAGAEILFETARFWASRAQLEADGLRHIRDVEGPDEYHEHIDDNAFTNTLARWNLRRGSEVAALLRARWPERWADLAGRLRLDETELELWGETAATLATGLDRSTGLLEQFAGFFALDEIDLAQYAGRTTPMDVVLGRERTQRSQVIKQADVVALLALLPGELDGACQEANFKYYEPRCDHSSSLSPTMHALVAARLGETELALDYFRKAASIDLGEPAERSAGGVHIAALGGLWQVAVFGFAGLSLRNDALGFDPHLPPSWKSLAFRIQWRGRQLKVRVDQAGSFTAMLEEGEPMRLIVAGEAKELLRGLTLHALWNNVAATGVPLSRTPITRGAAS